MVKKLIKCKVEGCRNYYCCKCIESKFTDIYEFICNNHRVTSDSNQLIPSIETYGKKVEFSYISLFCETKEISRFEKLQPFASHASMFSTLWMCDKFPPDSMELHITLSSLSIVYLHSDFNSKDGKACFNGERLKYDEVIHKVIGKNMRVFLILTCDYLKVAQREEMESIIKNDFSHLLIIFLRNRDPNNRQLIFKLLK